MASNTQAYHKEQERKLFLQRARTFTEVSREAMTRVQFMKTRHAKAFEVGEDGYDLYARAKRALSKMEYNQRQMKESETEMELATVTEDTKAFKEADTKYEQHMKNAIFYAFGVGQLYNQFLEKAPIGSL